MKRRIYSEYALGLLKDGIKEMLSRRNISLRKAASILGVPYITLYTSLTQEGTYPNIDLMYELALKIEPDHPVVSFIKELKDRSEKQKKESHGGI